MKHPASLFQNIINKIYLSYSQGMKPTVSVPKQFIKCIYCILGA